MSKPLPCQPHSLEARQRLHADPELGCGNFLFKVLEQPVDRGGALFFLEQPWRSPAGIVYASLTLVQLCEAVADLTAWYWRQGVRAGHVVCVYTEEGLSQFLHALALISLRAIPAPVSWRMRPEIALTYHRKYQFDFFTFDGHGQAHALQQLGATDVRFLDADTSGADVPPDGGAAFPPWPAHFDAQDETIMICHSSGTTGIPKAVLFGHQQFFFGKRDRLLHFPQCNEERMVSALPHSHSAGFSYLMTAVLLGMPTLVLSQLASPAVAARIAEFAPTVLAAFPQTYAALADAALKPGALPSLRRCYNTGDTAHEAHVRALLTAAPKATFHDGFGASELGMALFTKVSSLESGIAGDRCVGHPVPFATARILDDEGKALPPGQIGYVALRSGAITPGYYRDPSLTKRCRTPDGDWLTGDVGYLDEAGAFYHLDRAVDVIATSRGTAYSLVLEEAVLKSATVPDVTVTGIPLSPKTTQMVTAFVSVPPEQAERCCHTVLDQLDDLLRQRLGGPVPACVVNCLPDQPLATGTTGKALKRTIREEFWAHHQAYEEGQKTSFDLAVFRNL
ncbi:class I adenylate-forming enzyme family protein [Pseudogulbenkiania subflava]|uniref:Acyl-CoA synthetase (AMP-forming)/AMP-acid ligase II n=1 Tax=Pseudogulbenkiania subflava DSM 22618 TaxID=1123014 RepID=A0A1Y6BT89_9NEIS|nr:class I adenylate-forming enzyme family protein [Pseudogulbenkiania subflava]SMF17030.1 Acyl-CoA synthetase (AMP-forming)/AMP-acid ligase II [Pseudogulbenkiania subflava DSM 22618]